MTHDEIAEIFRIYCVGFGHTKGTDISKGCFTVGSGRHYDLHPFSEVEDMVSEILIATECGYLSPCQKSVLHQLKSYGILQAFQAIAEIEDELKQGEQNEN